MRPNLVVTGVLLLIAELVSLFLLCEVGQTLTTLNEDEFDALYKFDWVDCSNDVMKSVNIMKSRLSKPLHLKAVLTVMSRGVFATMINTAYSYINVALAAR